MWLSSLVHIWEADGDTRRDSEEGSDMRYQVPLHRDEKVRIKAESKLKEKPFAKFLIKGVK